MIALSSSTLHVVIRITCILVKNQARYEAIVIGTLAAIMALFLQLGPLSEEARRAREQAQFEKNQQALEKNLQVLDRQQQQIDKNWQLIDKGQQLIDKNWEEIGNQHAPDEQEIKRLRDRLERVERHAEEMKRSTTGRGPHQ